MPPEVLSKKAEAGSPVLYFGNGWAGIEIQTFMVPRGLIHYPCLFVIPCLSIAALISILIFLKNRNQLSVPKK
jgi:hypothetical protein